MAHRVLSAQCLTHDPQHDTKCEVERKDIQRKTRGRQLDEQSASGRAVRLVRDEGYSQSEAAIACGISQSAVSRAISIRERLSAAEVAAAEAAA